MVSRLKGEKSEGGCGASFLAVGNERADESHTRALAEFRNAEKNVSGTA